LAKNGYARGLPNSSSFRARNSTLIHPAAKDGAWALCALRQRREGVGPQLGTYAAASNLLTIARASSRRASPNPSFSTYSRSSGPSLVLSDLQTGPASRTRC
jgi:hypothetical protein